MNSIDTYISEVVRNGDRARYVAALLAPRTVRSDLMALYAFDLEILVIPDRVVEPLAGEIRLQWWRDFLSSTSETEHSGNPVADAMRELIGQKKLQSESLLAYLDAQSRVFHKDREADRAALERFFEATHGAVYSMACELLIDKGDFMDRKSTAAISAATGYVKLLSEFGKNASKGRVMIPSETLNSHNINTSAILQGKVSESVVLMLDEIRELARGHLAKAAVLVGRMEPRFAPAIAHLAMLRSVLKALEKNRENPIAPPPILNPLTSQWRVWRAARSLKI